jgi:ankyrin repeat protein
MMVGVNSLFAVVALVAALTLLWVFVVRRKSTTATGGESPTVASSVLADYRRKLHSDTLGSDVLELCEGHKIEIKTKVEALIAQGADVNYSNYSYKNTALHALTSSPYRDDVSLQEILVKHGAKVDSRNWCGQTPLQASIEEHFVRRSMTKIHFLLAHGASVHTVDRCGYTPLHSACRSVNVSVDLVKLLLEYGANVNVRTDEKDTPLHFACDFRYHRKVPKVEVVKLLLEHGANLYATNSRGETPLSCAKSNGYNDIVKLLDDWKHRFVRMGTIKHSNKQRRRLTNLYEYLT